MNANSPNLTPRRRKAPPRRTPAIIEQRERKPLAFGWGADLDRRQREALKERIALFSGIAIAAVLAILLGWGWYQDNVAGPAARARVYNQAVAVVGKDTIRYGYYVRVAKFNKKQLEGQLTQLQQQQAQLQSNPKKNAAALAQINAQLQSFQQQAAQLPTAIENNLIDDSTLFQQAPKLGVSVSQKEVDKQLRQYALQTGGVRSLERYITGGGLTHNEFATLIKSDLLKKKVSDKLAKETPRTQVKVRASHILVSAKKKTLAEKIYKEAQHGAIFAALAKKYSIDPGSAKKGGDLGWALPSSYVGPFSKAVTSMPVGSFKLVKSQFGWHIIKLVGRKKVKLSSSEYKQAQQSAFQTWLQQQQSQIGVRRLMDVSKIPGISPDLSGLSGSSNLQLPSQGQIPQPQPQAPPAKSGKATGKSGKSTAKSGSSTGKSGTGKKGSAPKK